MCLLKSKAHFPVGLKMNKFYYTNRATAGGTVQKIGERIISHLAGLVHQNSVTKVIAPRCLRFWIATSKCSYTVTFVTSANGLNRQLYTKTLETKSTLIQQSIKRRHGSSWHGYQQLTSVTRSHIFLFTCRIHTKTKLHRWLDIKSVLTYIWIYRCLSSLSVSFT